MSWGNHPTAEALHTCYRDSGLGPGQTNREPVPVRRLGGRPPMALLHSCSLLIHSQKVAASGGSLIKNHIQSNCHPVDEKVSSGWKWQEQAPKMNARLKVQWRHEVLIKSPMEGTQAREPRGPLSLTLCCFQIQLGRAVSKYNFQRQHFSAERVSLPTRRPNVSLGLVTFKGQHAQDVPTGTSPHTCPLLKWHVLQG